MTLLCKALRVSTSGYYKHRAATEASSRQQRHNALAEHIMASHRKSRNIYGYRKVAEDIRQGENISCCDETVRRIMKEKGLCSKTRKRFVRTTVSDERQTHAANILDRDFTVDAINKKWTADITFIATAEGWLYLAAVMDLYSRKIIGWAMSAHIDSDLVCRALKAAYERRRPKRGALHHSDRGVQYASEAYRDLLGRYGMVCSMSRRGNCWDNAGQESFFGKLKSECVGGRIFKSRDEARKEIFDYIEIFYNNQRRHAALGYVSPAEFERRAQNTNAA